MKMGIAVMEPILMATARRYLGKVVIGTVQGDLHDIGKNLVAMMLQGSGYEVIDLGVDVKPDKFVAAIKEHQPDVLGMSALLTTTMRYMNDTIEAVARAGLRSQIKIVIGGAPVTPRFAEQIGADRYVPDAGAAAAAIEQLLGRRRN